MAVRQMLAVARSEIRYLTRTGALWKLIGVHCALLAATLLLSWPPAERLTAFEPPQVLKWVLMAHVGALAYIILLLAADGVAWGEADRPRVVHWVAYGACPAWAAIAGRLLSLWHVLASLTAAALPLMILAHGASPIGAGSLLALAAVALVSLSIVGLIGLAVGCLSSDRSTRLIAVDAIALGIATLLFLLGSLGERPGDGLLFYLNPVKVLSFHLSSEALRGEASSFSWPLWLGLQGALSLSAGLLAARCLSSWKRRPPPERAGGLEQREPGRSAKGA